MVFLTGARPLRGWSLPMFYLSVVLEGGHVVGRGLDAQDVAELVVHLDRGIAEAMLDAGAFDPGGELRADLLGQLRGDLAAEKGGDLLRLHAQHRLPRELLIQRPERGGGAEHQIGGIFHLHQAPVIGLLEHVLHRAAQRRIAIEHKVQPVRATSHPRALAHAPNRRCERKHCRRR